MGDPLDPTTVDQVFGRITDAADRAGEHDHLDDDVAADLRRQDLTGAAEFATTIGRMRIIGLPTDDVEHLDVDEVVLPLALLTRLVNHMGAILDPKLPDGRRSS